MLHLQEIINLDTQETVVSMFRSHPFRMVSRAIPLIVSLIFLFLFIWLSFSLGPWGVIVFFLLFFIGVFFLCRNVFNWLGTYCVLTNKRLLCIQRTGFFKKQVHEILLENITELSYVTKGIVQTLFHFGNIRLTLGTARGEFVIPEIAKPQSILDILSHQASAVRKRKHLQTLQGAARSHDSRQEDVREDGVSVMDSVDSIKKEIHDF